MSSASRRFLFLGALLPLLALACDDHSSTTTAAEVGVLRASLAVAERTEIAAHVDLQGTVEADRNAAVSARVMARVTAVHVHAGEHVDRGQLLLVIDPQVSEGQESQARGALAQAQAGLALAERNSERFVALAAKNAASELEADMARMQYEQAKGAVEQAKGAVESAAAVAADSRVTAPFAGRIVQRLVEVGDLAAPGRPLLMIQSELSRRLAVAVPESLAVGAGLAPGDPLLVEIDTRADLGVIEGAIEEMAPGADPLSHSVLVKIGLPHSNLATGATGRARIPAASRPAVVVPATALHRRGGLELVVIRNQQGLASSRVVTTGRRLDGDRIEVLSGLDGGESLLLDLETVPPAGLRVEAL